MEATKTIAQFIEDHGITIESSAPWAHYDKAEDWPAIAHSVTLSTPSRKRSAITYKLGIGHVKLSEDYAMTIPRRLIPALNTMIAHKRLADRRLEAEVAAYAAARQQVSPGVDDVLDNLRMSLSDFYNRLSFEDFCASYGYDEDSRRAEKTYHALVQEGRDTYDWLGEALAVELMECESL